MTDYKFLFTYSCPNIFRDFVLRDFVSAIRVLCTVSSYPAVNDTANMSLRRLREFLEPLNETLHNSPPAPYNVTANFIYEGN